MKESIRATLNIELCHSNFSIIRGRHSVRRTSGGNWPRLSEAWMPTPSLRGRTSRRVWASTLPRYIQQEFDDVLQCGRLEYGFLRVRCEDCHHERRADVL